MKILLENRILKLHLCFSKFQNKYFNFNATLFQSTQAILFN